MKPAFSFVTALNQLYGRRNPLREFMERTGRIHPSQIHDPCPRKVVLELLRVIPEVAPKADVLSQRIFDTGHMYHTLFQWYSAKMVQFGILKACSIEQSVVAEELMISGRADLEFTPLEFEDYIIDFKTIKHERYNKLRKPESKDITQLQLYMDIRKKKRGLLFYHNKNTHVEKEFEVLHDPAYVEIHKKTIRKCIACYKKKTIPKREEFGGAKLYNGKPSCANRFCMYRPECLRPESDRLVVGNLNLWDGESALPGDGDITLGGPPSFNHGITVSSECSSSPILPQEKTLTTSQQSSSLKLTNKHEASGWSKILKGINAT